MYAIATKLIITILPNSTTKAKAYRQWQLSFTSYGFMMNGPIKNSLK